MLDQIGEHVANGIASQNHDEEAGEPDSGR
jgi:hypothetical protein